MLNNAWPSVIWHLYDYYLQPAGGYFGTKKACEPVHIQYSYDDRSVVVVNSANRDFNQLTAEASVYDFNLRRLFFREIHLDSAADSVHRLVTLPSDNIDSQVYFVKLVLLDKNHSVVSSNFYWLPKTLSTYNWSDEDEQKHPYYTGVTSYEDLSLLNQLKRVHLDAAASIRHPKDGEEVQVRIHNPSGNLAFQVQLSVVDDKTGDEILPVLWDDNYFSLLPGESRIVSARYSSAAGAGRLRLEVNGWNIDPEAALAGETK
jgi:exo-1,4-beta-D-glucosaminidase